LIPRIRSGFAVNNIYQARQVDLAVCTSASSAKPAQSQAEDAEWALLELHCIFSLPGWGA